MTQTLSPRPAVSVEELKAAWSAVAAGRFRAGIGIAAARDLRETPYPTAGLEWEPWPGERVLPVIGCAGSCGASTISLALALAGAATMPARVVECSSLTASGLAAASTAELGLHQSGWMRGTRDGVLIERSGNPMVSIQQVTAPSAPHRPIGLTVLDVGWEIGQVLASPAWLGEQVRRADMIVLVTTATVPGLRRLEAALDLLAGTSTRAAVVGPKPKKWPRPVRYSAGPRSRDLEAAGHLVDIPPDRALAIAGVDATALPSPVRAAAGRLLRLLPTPDTTMKGNTP